MAGAFDQLEPADARGQAIEDLVGGRRHQGILRADAHQRGARDLRKIGQEVQLHQQLPAAAIDLGVLDPTRKLFLAGHAWTEGGEHPRRLVVGDVLARVIASRQGRDLVAGLAPEPLDQAVQVKAGEGAEQDQSAAMTRMTRSVKDRDEAAHRMAKDDRPFDPERIAERANVVGAGLEGPGGGIAPR